MAKSSYKYLFVVLTSILLLSAGCNSDSSRTAGYEESTGYQSGYTNSYNSAEIDEPSEPENPYSSDQEGHYAGYEWAEENDVDSCGGNSDSFIEGCQDYVDQRDEYQEQQDQYDDWQSEQDYR
jgi:hypothetical protein